MKYVISLGGSLIIPREIDTAFIKKFSTIIKTLVKKGNSVVIVTGGGSIARKYISVVKASGLNKDYESLVGIETTKLNASLVAAFLERFHLLPKTLDEVAKMLAKDKIVVTGALGFQPKMTSDGDAALIAERIKAGCFINLTNVDGLYTKDPKLRGAEFIEKISFRDFNRMASRIRYSAGQHFVLDQSAAKTIMKNKTRTIIMKGNNLKNLSAFFSGKKFRGTVIDG